jgi:hypothetical protein
MAVEALQVCWGFEAKRQKDEDAGCLGGVKHSGFQSAYVGFSSNNREIPGAQSRSGQSGARLKLLS